MKKIIFGLMMICMMVMSSGVVWADLMPIDLSTGKFIYYEEPANFLEYLESPLKEISILLLLSYVVIGFTLLIVKKMKKEEKVEECKRKSKLEIIFVTISILLSIVSLFIIKGVLDYTIGSWGAGGSIYTYIVSSRLIWDCYIVIYVAFSIIPILKKNIKKSTKNMSLIIITTLLISIIINFFEPAILYFIFFWIIVIIYSTVIWGKSKYKKWRNKNEK